MHDTNVLTTTSTTIVSPLKRAKQTPEDIKEISNTPKKQKLSPIKFTTQVPSTPPKPNTRSPIKSPNKTPTRILLGIDKGLKAEDVSLKWPRRPSPQKHSPFTNSKNSSLKNIKSKLSSTETTNHKTLSLAEKLVNTRKQNKAQIEEKISIKNSRVYAFGIDNFNSKEDLKTIEKETQEKYSKLYLKSLYLPTEKIDEALKDMKILNIEKLFAKVRPPKFEQPQYANFTVLGIIAQKSEPRETSNKKGKFMKITLTDLSISIDFMLFGNAFEKYWKLRVGDLIGILNPEIWPWRTDDKTAKSFNIVLTESYDAIIEIGKARDLGFCPATTKNGHSCNDWINNKRQSYCDYHAEQSFRKTASNRLELNTSIGLKSPTKNGVKQHMYMPSRGGKTNNYDGKYGLKEDPHKPKADRMNNGSMLYFSSNHAGKAFFDDQYSNPTVIQNISEKQMKINTVKKDKQLAKKLSKIKGGERLNLDYNLDEKEDARLDANEKKKEIKLIEAAYGGTLQKIGFDPTRRLESLTTETVHPSKYTIGSVSAGNVHLSPGKDSKERRKVAWGYTRGISKDKNSNKMVELSEDSSDSD